MLRVSPQPGHLTPKTLRDQHVSGIGMTLLATGLAFYFYRLIFGQPPDTASINFEGSRSMV